VIEEDKNAVLLANSSESGTTFNLVNSSSGNAVFNGTVGASLGSWSSSFADTYALNFSSFNVPGPYFLRVQAPVAAVSPTFLIGTGAHLYEQALANALFFYLVQQDGPNVNSSAMDRQPSHLTDEEASVYSQPTYVNDVLQGTLQKIGGPINASGGWFDAGDYIKFVETASYATAIMLFAVRQYPGMMSGNATDFRAEVIPELGWLLRMWNESTEMLYYQVGIGDGNSKITGDHDLWRLPQADDQLNVSAGNSEYYIKYRPVFDAGPTGSLISPNLAGRLAADFGLCFQVFYLQDPALADQCIFAGETVYSLANTTEAAVSTSLLTTSPYDYYPETSWQDDMELGATELCLATQLGHLPKSLPHSDPMYYLESAANWSYAYINGAEDGTDTLNLYDVSGLAHYELYHAIEQAGNPTLAITKAALIGDLAQQIQQGTKASAKDPFEFGVPYNSGEDMVPHGFGFVLESNFYDQLAGVSTYQAFGLDQLNWILGENAWGSSFVVGDGTVFPHCMQHQVANLVGSLDGTPPIDYGATVDGPTQLANLNGLSMQTGMRACPAAGGDAFKVFDGKGAGYMDNVIAWPTVEPADDYTALSIVAFAMQISSSGGSLAVSSFNAAPNPITVGQTTNLSVSASGGLLPYTFAYAGLPNGCTSSNVSILSCTPKVSGVFTVRVYVNDSMRDSANITTTLTVHPLCGLCNGLVEISPSSGSLPIGGVANFTAVAICTGTCPPGIAYSWALTNTAMGKLNATAGTSVAFTARSTLGTVGLFVNATLNGDTIQSLPDIITISEPTLTSVVVNPASALLNVGGSQSFTVTPTCNAPCPVGIAYSWALTNANMGKLNSTTGGSVDFTADSTVGTVSLFVNATLDGVTRHGLPTVVSIETPANGLISVAVSPAAAYLVKGEGLTFTATPACSLTICPAGAVYAWTLTNSSAGTLNASTGNPVMFTAEASVQKVTLFVNATLDGAIRQGSATVSVIDLVSVTTSPQSYPTLHVGIGVRVDFVATAVCSPIECPSNVTYVWALNDSLGSLNSNTGFETIFMAGNVTGTVTLTVTAGLGGQDVSNKTSITIFVAPCPCNAPGVAGYWLLVVVGVVVAMVAIAAVLILLHRRRKRDAQDFPPPDANRGKPPSGES
jgi:hypothetical protein